MGKRDRFRRTARSASFRDPKPVVLVVCEGDATEPEYLDGFVKACHNPRVRIQVAGGKGVPMCVVDEAKGLKKVAELHARREKDENLNYDEVWCVFDIDAHPNVAHAKQTAIDNGINLAISNPCIELWLLLHFREQPGMQTRHVVHAMLCKFVSNYNKHVRYSDYATGVDDAVKRASRLERDALSVDEESRNPTTGIWRLIQSIRSSA